MADTLRSMSTERRRTAPVCKPGLPGARMTLERTIGRCLEPNPDDRFASGAELAEQLEGCRRLREAERQLPQFPAMFAPILRRPFHVARAARRAAAGGRQHRQHRLQLDADRRRADARPSSSNSCSLVIGYNAIVYPLAILAFVIAVRPVWRCWNALAHARTIARRRRSKPHAAALRLPRLIAGLTAIGWFPGGVIFPLVIQADHRPRNFDVPRTSSLRFASLG